MSTAGKPIAVQYDLIPIRYELIENLNSGREPPVKVDNLPQWLLEEGWAGVSQESDIMCADGLICLDPSQFDTLDLSDEGLRGEISWVMMSRFPLGVDPTLDEWRATHRAIR